MQNWFRTFFPSWRLFENLGEVPVLYFRSAYDENQLGDWKKVNQNPLPQGFLQRIFFNPLATKRHADQNLLYQFLYDIENAIDSDRHKQITSNKVVAEGLSSYKAIQKWIEQNVPADHWYQFQVCSFDQLSRREDVLVTSAVFRKAVHS